MQLVNDAVALLLQSPVHGLLSSSVALVRYRSTDDRLITTPVQWAPAEDDVVLLAGHAEDKTWWHHFREEQELDLLVQGRWRAMRAQAVLGGCTEELRAELDPYLHRFPHVARHLPEATEPGAPPVVVVHCRPLPVTPGDEGEPTGR